MKRTQKTKRALVASVVSMAMCCALLLGTTFAWFTDSVTNTGNVITAGNLKIDATAYDLGTGGVSVTIPGVNNDSSFTFENTGLDLKSDAAKNTPIISEPLWEPGQSNAKLLEIKNSGNLAANIRLDFDVKDDGLQDALWFDFVQVSPQQGQFTKRDMSDLRTLAQSMVFTLEQNESMRFVLVYGMEEEAGNEYQGKAFSADVTVMATQAPVETDGFGNSQYDAAANGDPDYPEWATGGTTQVTKPSEGWAETTTLTVPGVTVSVPKEAIAKDANALKLSVLAKAEQPSGITVPVNEGQEARYYEITLKGLAEDNANELSMSCRVGQNLTGVKFYNGNSELQNVQYDPNTGIAIFTTTSVSHLTVVYAKPWEGSVDTAGLEANTDSNAKTVSIDTAAQLAAFAQEVKDGNTYSGYTVTLTADMDLSGANWPSIGSGGKRFQGTFDGAGHVITGMNAVNDVNYGNAFFADISGAVIKNVSFENAYVSRYGKASSAVSGNVYAIVCGYAYGNVTFENVHVKNSAVRGYGKVGTILGMAADPGTTVTKLKNCTVENVDVTAVYNAGGLIGLAQNQVELDECTTTDVYGNLADSTSKYVTVNSSATKYVNGISTGETVPVNGKYWKYSEGGVNWYYAAWGDYYTDYYYSGDRITDWRLTDFGQNSYIADGLCHNR